jgi:hypothetical protein
VLFRVKSILIERAILGFVPDMTKLKDKIQTGLDESRMLVLGAQILIGFAFSANFQPTFRDLPARSQNLNLLALTDYHLLADLVHGFSSTDRGRQ